MKTETEQLYDVVIYEIATRKIDAIIGKSMKRWNGTGSGRNTAEFRQQTAEERINDRYAVEIVEADKFHKGDLLPNEKSSATGDPKPSPAKAELQAPTPVGCSGLLDGNSVNIQSLSPCLVDVRLSEKHAKLVREMSDPKGCLVNLGGLDKPNLPLP